jgi:hypothetical protein
MICLDRSMQCIIISCEFTASIWDKIVSISNDLQERVDFMKGILVPS